MQDKREMWESDGESVVSRTGCNGQTGRALLAMGTVTNFINALKNVRKGRPLGQTATGKLCMHRRRTDKKTFTKQAPNELA